MALLEKQTDIASASHESVPYIGSPRSISSIKSFRDIPFVETSFDPEFDTVLGERNGNINSAFFSTPRCSKGLTGTSSPRSLGPVDSPWFPRSASRISEEPSDICDSDSGESYESQRLNDNISNSREGTFGEEHDGNDFLDKQSDSNKQFYDAQLLSNYENSSNLERSSIEKDSNSEENSNRPKISNNSHLNINEDSFTNITDAQKLSSNSVQRKLMDEIAASAGALASMKEYLDAWAPAAHYVVVAAAALQRDSATFAAILTSLLESNTAMDPAQFSTQYYHLREAYSSLLSLGNFNIALGGQQGLAQNPARYSPTHGHGASSVTLTALHDDDMETIWDDRQLVDSFMTLLRTSPGFLASTFLQMSTLEIESFAASGDESPLSILFHGLLGSAKANRPRIFIEVLKHIRSDFQTASTLTEALLQRFLGLSVGNLPPKGVIKLDRFLRLVLNRKTAIPNFEPILASCIPNEFAEFIQHILLTDELEVLRPLINNHLLDFLNLLICSPHQFGLLQDVFIGERLKFYLDGIASRAKDSVTRYIENCYKQRPSSMYLTEFWQADELIAVKGSDIVLMYNSLLPNRSSASNSQVLSTNSSDDDEWCLDSIREDLVPVMQGLAHSTKIKYDGWQIFKIGEDGLVTDLGSDMGLKGSADDHNVNPQMEAFCEAVAYHDGPTVIDRLNAYREDAQLRGDHLTLLNLEDIETLASPLHLQEMRQRVTLTKMRCKTLREMLDRASHDQRQEQKRLAQLLSILDSARVLIWYEAEVRNGSSYLKGREFLQVLYPKAKEDEEERLSDGNFGSGGLSTIALGFGFGIGTQNAGEYSGSANAASSSSSRSRRLSLLSSHSAPESPFYNRVSLYSPKLTDKECDTILNFMRRNRVRNIVPAEERFSRALVEIANLARKIVEREHLASYITFKRDRAYQTQHNQQLQTQISGGSQRLAKRNSHHRRSSLGLFDFFDSSSNFTQSSMPLTLHTTTSTQFLNLTSSHDSLRNPAPHSNDDCAKSIGSTNYLGPPKVPNISEVQALLLSDLGYDILAIGTETDSYMQQTGRMLLEGDSQNYQPLLDDISIAGSPNAKLSALESLLTYTRSAMHRKKNLQRSVRVSRSDIIYELSKVIGREPGTVYRDLQVVSMLVNPVLLDKSEAFEDCSEAVRLVIDTVVLRSMDYAARFLRYYMETTSTTAPKMALMGVNDSVAIWAFCAKQGNREAQNKLAELYIKFPHLKVDLKPLTRPSGVFDGCGGDANAMREAVIMHWTALATRI